MPPVRALLRLALALAALATFASPALAAQKGVVTDVNWGIAAGDQDRQLALMQDAGVGWTRLSVGWHRYEPTKGSYDPVEVAKLDRVVEITRARGIDIVINVLNAPAWASDTISLDTQGNTPRDPADYAAFMRHLAARYKGVVRAYEVWNEPDLKYFWINGSQPERYAALLKATYPQVKAADPAARVVFAGLDYTNYSADYLKRAYAAGAKGSFDVMAVHPYTYCGMREPELTKTYSDGTVMEGSFTRYRNLRKIMVDNGDAKPVWLTEFGWSTSATVCNRTAGVYYGGVSEATQADYVTRAYKLLEQDPYVEVAFWYTFRDVGTADTTLNRYGLVRKDFTAKPALQAYKAYTPPGGSPPSSSGTTSAPAAPTVTLTAPATGDEFVKSLSFTADAGDDRGVTKVEFRVDGRTVATDTTAPYAYTWNASKKTSYAQHTVQAKAFDADGNTTLDSATVTRVKSTSTTLSGTASASSAGRRQITLRGKVKGTKARRVLIVVQRFDSTTIRWKAVKKSKARVKGGRFAKRITVKSTGRLRAQARYRGAGGAQSSASRWLRF